MNSTSSENDTLELGLILPIEVNVIVLNRNGVPNTPSSIYQVSYNQDEKNDSVVFKSEDHPDHIMQDIITDEPKNKSGGDDIFINIDNDTETEQTDTTNRSNADTPLVAEVESTNSNIVKLYTGTPDNDTARACYKDESHTKIDDQSLEGNETLNQFLDDLYEKEVDLGCNFSDQEINNIRAAVFKQVNLIAHRIHEIDSRLKIQEVLPVGSAREGTQIVRPCEYDFILILDALSKPGAVKMVPEDPESYSREYMHVKLNDDYVKSIFHEFSNNDYIRASRLLPWDRYGLQDFFSTAVSQVVMLCSRSYVKMGTGKLKLKRSKPEINGPACTIQLLWERATTQDKTAMEMLISIDLCPAIRLDFEEYYQLLPTSAKAVSNDLSDDCSTDSVRFTNLKSTESVLQSADKSFAKDLDHEAPLETCGFNPARSDAFVVSFSGTEVPNHLDHVKSTKPVLSPSRNINANDLDYAKSIKSILLMPRDDMQFKVTFTDAEVTLTLNMSEHHKKCYTLLKYLINGEPTPLQRHRYRRMKKLFDYFLGFRYTYFHSYLIKQVVWDHHYIEKCNEEVNIGLCVTWSLSKLQYRQDTIHPFNRNMLIYTSKFEEKYNEYSELTKENLRRLASAINAIKCMQKDDYKYEYCRNLTKGDQVSLKKFLFPVHCICCIIMAISVFIACVRTRNDLPHIIYLLSRCLIMLLWYVFMLYVIYLRDTFNSKWKLLTKRLSLCTEHIGLWIICNCLAIYLVLMLMKFDWLITVFFVTTIVMTCSRLYAIRFWLATVGLQHLPLFKNRFSRKNPVQLLLPAPEWY